MKSFLCAVTFLLAILFCPPALQAQASGCSHLTKYTIWGRMASFSELYDPGISYFEEFLAFDSYFDFACEVDSIVLTTIPPSDWRYKFEFVRNANGDITSMTELGISNGSIVPKSRFNFDWDYAANKAVGIREDYSTGQWEFTFKAEVGFNPQGLMAQLTQYYWTNNNWEFHSDATYEYDSFGNLTQNTTDYFSVFFENYQIIDYTYTPENRVQMATFSNDDTGQLEPYIRVIYEYSNNNKTKATASFFDEATNAWCDGYSTAYDYQNDFPVEGHLFYDTSETCTTLANLGTPYSYIWDTDKNRLLQMDVRFWDEGVRFQFYYDGMTADASQRPSASLGLCLPNPLQPGQPFNLDGLPVNKDYEFYWLDLNGKIHSHGLVNAQMQAPDAHPGMYFLFIRDLETGHSGTQKVVLQRP